MGVQNQDVTSPGASEIQDGQDTVEPTVVVAEEGADSSTETPEKGEKASLLDVVRDAVDKTKAGSTDSASPTGQEESGTPSDDGGDTSEPDSPDATMGEDDFKDVPFNNHPRFKQLIAERRDLIAERDGFRTGHENFARVEAFMQANSLSAEEVADAMSIAALRKSNPKEAWGALKPIVQDLLQQLGEIMPPDLRERVQKGELTAEDAREISRARAGETVLVKRQEHDQKRQEIEAQNRAARQVTETVAAWETGKRGSDVDFDAKSDDLQKEILWLQRRDGKPTDQVGVQKMLNEAYANVNKRFKPATPKAPITPVRSSGVPGGTAPSAPKSVLDIVKSARTA